jgi:hypothetical protein
VSKTFSIVMGALAVAGLALGGMAYASIPDGDDEIHGCYGNSNGQLRVIDNAQGGCKNNETALSWNNQGPQGLQGPQGGKGDKGDPGTPGASGVSHAYEFTPAAVEIPNDSAFHDVASLALPAGKYVVLAKTVASVLPTTGFLQCLLASPASPEFVDVSALELVNAAVGTVSVQGTVSSSSATNVVFRCATDAPGLVGQNTHITAIAVDQLN